MNQIPSSNPEAYPGEDLHLFHFGLSSCSQRVRLALEEKGLAWRGYHVDLSRFEHLSDTYQAINPAGVVPVLIHRQQVVADSIAIIQYLDDQFPSHPLMPLTEQERNNAGLWLKRASELERPLKTLTYDRIFRKTRQPDEDDLRFYAEHQGNQELVEFFTRYVRGFSVEELAQCEKKLGDFLEYADSVLEENRFLFGNTLTLADVAVIPIVHRAVILGFDFTALPRLQDWHGRIRSRQSFDKAILAYGKLPDTGRAKAAGIA